MTFFVKLENGSPVNNAPLVESNVRALLAPVNLPTVIAPSDIEPHGYGIYDFSNPPKDVEKYKKVVETLPVKDALGIWRQTWEIVDMNDEEKVQADIMQAEAVKQMRNSMLFMSDWTRLDDAPVNKTAWATYRQKLRDISKQSGFPWDVKWPTKPE